MKSLKYIIITLLLSLNALATFALTPVKKTAVIASDPSGLVLKNTVKEYLQKQGFEVVDLTGEKHQNYVDVGFNMGKAMSENNYDFGFVFCGTGMGVNLVSNKFNGVFCALCESVETARLSRVVNNANVLAMGGNIIKPDKAVEMVSAFISTNFASDNEFLKNSYNHFVELTKEITQLNLKNSKK